MATCTLIILAFMVSQSPNKSDSVGVTSVAGFKSKDACEYAAIEASAGGEKHSGPYLKGVCITGPN
jgi:hypothetical protein